MGDTAKAIDDLPTGAPCHDRNVLEKRLVRKLDLRMSVIVILYTLNMVSPKVFAYTILTHAMHLRSTDRMLGVLNIVVLGLISWHP
jgi:hypothetical protein